MSLALKGLQQNFLNFERQQKSHAATLAFLALCLFERDHAGLPTAINDLVPAYLPAVSLLESTGKPLDYDPAKRILAVPMYETFKLDFAPPPTGGTPP